MSAAKGTTDTAIHPCEEVNVAFSKALKTRNAAQVEVRALTPHNGFLSAGLFPNGLFDLCRSVSWLANSSAIPCSSVYKVGLAL